MANHRSAAKQHKQSLVRAQRNRGIKSKVKTLIKKVDAAVQSADLGQAVSSLRAAESAIMKAVSKKVLKLNMASRKVSKLTHSVKTIDPSYKDYKATKSEG